MLVTALQVAMDVVLMAGRVFILLLNINRLPPEEAVLVLSVSASFVIAAIGYIVKDGDAFDTIFSKWMLPALFNPALVWLMALFSESARRTFNNTVSYAPGLAFFSPLGVASFVLMLDVFMPHTWLEDLAAFAYFTKSLVVRDRGGGGLPSRSTPSSTSTVKHSVSRSTAVQTTAPSSTRIVAERRTAEERAAERHRPPPPRLPVRLPDTETRILVGSYSRVPED